MEVMKAANWYQLKALAEDGAAAGPWHGAWVYVRREDGRALGYLDDRNHPFSSPGWMGWVMRDPVDVAEGRADWPVEALGFGWSDNFAAARKAIEDWWAAN